MYDVLSYQMEIERFTEVICSNYSTRRSQISFKFQPQSILCKTMYEILFVYHAM